MRRVRGIGGEIVAFVLVTVLLPVLLLGAAVVDLVLWLRRRKPWVGVRLVAFLWWFLFGEMRALRWRCSASGSSPAGRSGSGSLRRRALALPAARCTGAAATSAASGSCSGCASRSRGSSWPGPARSMIMMRHASIIDNMLPDAFVGRTHGMGLRYVIKRELQMIPTIDIGGRWVPTNFVRRGSGDTDREVAALRSLADDLGRRRGRS